MAKIARPTEPPICRKSELRPVASVSFVRSMRESATVVSGTKRHANPTPCQTRAWTMSGVPVASVKWLIIHDPIANATTPTAMSSRGETRL